MTSFENVEYGFEPSSCSPPFDTDEPNGIKIAVPKRYEFSVGATGSKPPRLPLCITMKFDALYLSRFSNVDEEIKVVVVDDDHHQVLSGGIWRNRHYEPSEPSRMTREQLAALISVSWNTVNLLEFFPLPRRSATYNIYAVLEEYKSNVATLRVEAP